MAETRAGNEGNAGTMLKRAGERKTAPLADYCPAPHAEAVKLGKLCSARAR